MRGSTKPHPVRRWIPYLLFFLLLVVFFGVIMLGPKRPPTTEEQWKSFHAHQAGFFFVAGELLAQKLAPASGENWSEWMDHKQADSDYLGNGVWHAYGMVAPSRTWEAYMLAPDATPLFVRVGDSSTGDLASAQQRAKAKPVVEGQEP